MPTVPASQKVCKAFAFGPKAFSANFTHVACRVCFNSLSDHVQSACLAVRELLPLKLSCHIPPTPSRPHPCPPAALHWQSAAPWGRVSPHRLWGPTTNSADTAPWNLLHVASCCGWVRSVIQLGCVCCTDCRLDVLIDTKCFFPQLKL